MTGADPDEEYSCDGQRTMAQWRLDLAERVVPMAAVAGMIATYMLTPSYMAAGG